MIKQELRARILEDSRSLISSVERYDYDNAYRNSKAVCENLLLLLEEEMYKENDNSEMFEK